MLDPKRIASSAAYLGWVVKNDGFFTEIQKGDVKLSLCNNSGAVVSESGHLLGVAERVEDIQSLFASKFATNILKGDNDLTYEFIREIDSDNISVIAVSECIPTDGSPTSYENISIRLMRFVPSVGKIVIDDASDSSSTTLPCMLFKLIDYSHFDDLNAETIPPPKTVGTVNFIDALAESTFPCATIYHKTTDLDIESSDDPFAFGSMVDLYAMKTIDRYDQEITTRWVDGRHLLVDIENAISSKWNLDSSDITVRAFKSTKIQEKELEDILAYQEDKKVYAMLSIIKLLRVITVSDFNNSVNRLINFIDDESLKTYARERLCRD